jgi:hypothetical protein
MIIQLCPESRLALAGTIGLALVKWPLLPERHPIKLLPVLLFESAWKLLWLSLVALPKAIAGDLDAATTETVISCSLVVFILVVTLWRYVWRHYLRATGDRWR